MDTPTIPSAKTASSFDSLATGHWPLTTLLLLVWAPLPTGAQNSAPIYQVERDQIYVANQADRQGKLYVKVQFKITRVNGQQGEDVFLDEGLDEIRVKEDGRPVKDLEIFSPRSSGPLTTVLAIDISGSMAEERKIDEAKEAARLFLDRLNPKSECGLILFDHKLRVQERPTDNRERLRALIDAARPRGGTAYLDATAEAIAMLRGIKGRRAVLLMTDGVDLNSDRTLKQVIHEARSAEVPVYTIGVGKPGEPTPVTTVLVLDCSGSMSDPADDTDTASKIDALHRAAGRFVDIMRPGARTTLLPFSDVPSTPKDFSADKDQLKEEIGQLEPGGQTALFDATHDAVLTLVAARPGGKRAVVVLTDGIDNRSHRSVKEVIAEARKAEIPLHMIGLGRPGELDGRVMQRMARETSGSYHHAANEQSLYEIFEDLSIQLHDNGVDEPALQELAQKTGGKYKSAKNISELPFIYKGLAQELQTTYTASFPSLRQDYDGTSRDIDITIWRNGVLVSNALRGGYNVSGVVVPEMDSRVYLGLLALLGGLLLVPAALRRVARRQVGA